EARTKNGWVIHSKGLGIIDVNYAHRKIVTTSTFRKRFWSLPSGTKRNYSLTIHGKRHSFASSTACAPDRRGACSVERSVMRKEKDHRLAGKGGDCRQQCACSAINSLGSRPVF